MTLLQIKDHAIHELLLDIYFSNVNIPEKLETCLQNIQNTTGKKRDLLIQQAIGYTVALKDFNLLNFRICDKIINTLHDARL